MWDGIVDVEQVKRFVDRNVVHLTGQGQRVGRMVKQRIVHHFHFVEVDAVREFGNTHWDGIADEMDVVTAGGKFQAQLCGDNAASSVRGVTGNSDFHGV